MLTWIQIVRLTIGWFIFTISYIGNRLTSIIWMVAHWITAAHNSIGLRCTPSFQIDFSECGFQPKEIFAKIFQFLSLPLIHLLQNKKKSMTFNQNYRRLVIFTTFCCKSSLNDSPDACKLSSILSICSSSISNIRFNSRFQSLDAIFIDDQFTAQLTEKNEDL